uniref:Replication initiator protein n=1 Tax=Dulem virus 252 TaxID=3145729 RepID=A0AAU8AY46_9VIRU
MYLSSQYSPLKSCEKPTYIRQVYSEDVLTCECGQCLSCVLAKSSKASLDATLFLEQYKYRYFVSLDYRTDCIPIMTHKYIPEMKQIYLESVVRPPVKLPTSRRKKDGSLVYRTFDFSVADEARPFCYCAPCSSEMEYREFVRKVNLDVQGKYPHMKKYFPYLSRYDISLFMKRLRNYLSIQHGTNIEFYTYIVGEYGPAHFRPHYHILFGSNDNRIASSLEHACNKAWQFGGVDFELANSGASSYVSSYVNSFVSLPVLFRKHRQTRPFSRRCKNFLLNRFNKDCPDFEERISLDLDGEEYATPKTSFRLYPRGSYSDRLYPKLFKDARFAEHQLLTLVTTVTRLARVTARKRRKFSAADLARTILRYVQFGNDARTASLRQFLHINETDIPLFRKKATYQIGFGKCYRLAYAWHSLFIYWTSFDITSHCIYKEIRQALGFVIRYYKERDYRLLCNQYDEITRFQLSDWFSQKDDILRWYSSSPSRFLVSRKTRKVSLSDNFPVSPRNKKLDDAIFLERSVRMERSVKHKVQNDRNMCFVDI